MGESNNFKENKRKIKASVDTDLLLNNNTVKDLIFDTYTISGLLEENTHLYQGVNLGYDLIKKKI
mgnify:CR=1 FL=1